MLQSPTGEFEIIQRIELPEAAIHVTQYQLAVYQDAAGNFCTPDSSELDGPIFGPRLLATIGWLKSVGHLSYSTLEAWMEDVLQVPVSRGYLAKLCTNTISASLVDSYQELVGAIPQQEQLGSDETSIKDNGKKHWIWCVTAAAFSVFYIAASRSREVLETLVGPEFAGYLNFDYFSANCSFAWNNWIKAQYCWAHLIRDIRFLAEKHTDKTTQAWAEDLLTRSRRLFSAWHRRDEMTAEGFRRSMLIHQDRYLEIVRKPPKTKEAANLAARFAIVEYTTEGSDDVQKQDRNFFEFLLSSITAHLHNQPTPSLLHG